MNDVLLSSERLLDRLGREELQMKQLGLVNHAAGIRTAIVALLKEVAEVRSRTGAEPRAH